VLFVCVLLFCFDCVKIKKKQAQKRVRRAGGLPSFSLLGIRLF
jgi:hypothetical protein